jgi:hypothetical protein
VSYLPEGIKATVEAISKLFIKKERYFIMPILTTDHEVGLREDLTTLDLIGDKYTAAYNKAKKVKATNPTHQWLEDRLAPGDANNAAVQGSVFNFTTTITREKKSNETQIFSHPIGISRSVLNSKLANGGNYAVTSELAVQAEKALLQKSRDIDAAMITGSKVVATDTVAGKMDGLINLTNPLNKYVTAAPNVVGWDDVDKGIMLIAEAGATPDTAIASDVKAMVAKLNRDEAPYQTVVIADKGDNRKRIEGSAVAFEGTAGAIEIFFDPRVPAGVLPIFDSSRWELAVLGEANVTNDITFDGVGKVLITECCAKLTHSLAASVMTIDT